MAVNLNDIKKASEARTKAFQQEMSEIEKVKLVRNQIKEIDKEIAELATEYNKATGKAKEEALEALKARKKEKSEIKDTVSMLSDEAETYDTITKRMDKMSKSSREILGFSEKRKGIEKSASIAAKQAAQGNEKVAEVMNDIIGIQLDSLDISSHKNLLAYDEDAALESIRNTRQEITILEEEGKAENEELLGILNKQVEAAEESVDKAAQLSKEAKNTKEAFDKLHENSMAYVDQLEGGVAAARAMIKELIKNPIMALVAAAAALGKAMVMIAEQSAEFRDNVGLSITQSQKLVRNMKLATLESKLLGYNLATGAGALVDQFGNLDQVSSKNLKTFGRMEKILGVSQENSATLFMSLQKVGGASEEGAMAQMASLKALGEANNIPIGKLFEDMSSSSEEIAAFGGENLTNIKRAAVEARRMGVNLGTSLKIADSLLDFESSISNEMEASLMIGKQLNFNRARQLALEGDVAGAARDVVKQIGGQAEFAKMNVLQRRKLAESIGVSVDELSKLASGKVEFKQPKDPNAPLISSTEMLRLAIEKLIIAMGVLGTAFLTYAVLSKFNLGGKLLAKLGMGGAKASATAVKGAGVATDVVKAGSKVVTKAPAGGLKVGGKFYKGGQFLPKAASVTAKTADVATDVAKTGSKTAGKAVAKTLGKSAIKKIPILGLLASGVFAAGRAMKGDFAGAGLELASGGASLLPGAGTAASVGIDALLLARDLKSKDTVKEQSAEIDNLQSQLDQQAEISNAATQMDGETQLFMEMLKQQGLSAEAQKEYNAKSLDLLQQVINEEKATRKAVNELPDG